MKQKQLPEEKIDEIVIAQANDDFAWEEAITVKRETPSTITLSPQIASRAAFLAELHKMPSLEAWVKRIIEERIVFEETAFADLKQSMTSDR